MTGGNGDTNERNGTARGIGRRAFIGGALPLALAACAPSYAPPPMAALDARLARRALATENAYAAIYGPLSDERFPIEALDLSEIDPDNLRRVVEWRGDEQPGTIVVSPSERRLHLVLEGGQAVRYGVGVGREGFGWSGRATIKRKAAWPTWTPPHEMTLRDPDAAKWAAGMPGGPENPLGARALYLYQGDRDTLYRLHGTNDPTTIGEAVSSGCVRLLNHDIIDLHRRVPVGTTVIVRPA
jgi:lipoprotein-anchoring transpeptidase ErfK/SrfK